MRAPRRALALLSLGFWGAACSLITDYRLAPEAAVDGGESFDATAGDAGPVIVADSGGQSDVLETDAATDAPPVCPETPCIVQIAAGAMATCARLDTGDVRCWGSNVNGVVGAATPDDFAIPQRVAFDGPVDDIVMGAWGRDYAAGCARRGGSIECWGADGADRRLGRGGGASAGTFVPIPAPVVGVANADEVTIGAVRTCARVGGAISCWGRELDAGVDLAPVPLTTPKPARRLAGGRRQICAVLDSDEVACAGYLLEFNPAWNDPNYPGSQVMELVSGVSGVAQIAELSAHVCVLKKGGDVACWGRNDSGQLGRGITETSSMVPAPVSGLPALAKAIGVGASHSCAVLVDDTVWCWGRNDGGIGDGNQASVRVRGQAGALPDGGLDPFTANPRKIEGLPAGPVRSVVGGYDHSCALMQSGAVYCWGSNARGQLGRGKADGGGPDDAPHPAASRVLF
jgi:hypothetical protein